MLSVRAGSSLAAAHTQSPHDLVRFFSNVYYVRHLIGFTERFARVLWKSCPMAYVWVRAYPVGFNIATSTRDVGSFEEDYMLPAIGSAKIQSTRVWHVAMLRKHENALANAFLRF